MPKKIKTKKKISDKRIFNDLEETSSATSIHPNTTMTPEASQKDSTSAAWLSVDSTSAPLLGEESEEPETYAKSNAALIDKYFLSKQAIPLPFLIILLLISFLFIQDNGAGNLTRWEGIFWTIQKSGVLIGMFIFIWLFQFFYKKTFKRKS